MLRAPSSVERSTGAGTAPRRRRYPQITRWRASISNLLGSARTLAQTKRPHGMSVVRGHPGFPLRLWPTSSERLLWVSPQLSCLGQFTNLDRSARFVDRIAEDQFADRLEALGADSNVTRYTLRDLAGWGEFRYADSFADR